MRWLLLFAALAAPALAQPTELDPDALLPLIGRPWAEAKVGIPPPDSGRVEGKAGTLRWRGEAHDVAAIYVHVRGGAFAALDAVAAPAAYGDFLQMADTVARELGTPGADGYYAADRVREMGRLGDTAVELRFDRARHTLSLRAPQR